MESEKIIRLKKSNIRIYTRTLSTEISGIIREIYKKSIHSAHSVHRGMQEILSCSGLVCLIRILPTAFLIHIPVAGILFAQSREMELISSQKIWDYAPHNAFTDLIRFRGNWYCVLREGESHVGGNGKIRVLTSHRGDQWESVALLEREGIDLRDPKISITPEKKLMLHIGGSIYVDGKLNGFKPAVVFSGDGKHWSEMQDININAQWPWRPVWHDGTVYVVSYDKKASLYCGKNGIKYEWVCDFNVDGFPTEAAMCFLPGDTLMILLRRDQGNRHAFIGKAVTPYTEWHWKETSWSVGGPALLKISANRVLAAGRCTIDGNVKTVIGNVNLEGFSPELILPSGGDCSYPGLIYHKSRIWMSYYSSHEGKTSVYLAKIRLK